MKLRCSLLDFTLTYFFKAHEKEILSHKSNINLTLIGIQPIQLLTSLY
jgi:hypothetical protein